MPKLVEVEHTKLQVDERIETSCGSKKVKQQLQKWRTLFEMGVLSHLHRFLKRKSGEPGNALAIRLRHSDAAATQPDTGEGLCEVCRTINFDAFFRVPCEGNCLLYNLGTAEDIQHRRSCAMCRLVAASIKASAYKWPQGKQYICQLIHNNIDGHGIKVCLTPASSKGESGEGGGWQIIRKTIEHWKPEDGLSIMPRSPPKPNDYRYGISFGRRMQSC